MSELVRSILFLAFCFLGKHALSQSNVVYESSPYGEEELRVFPDLKRIESLSAHGSIMLASSMFRSNYFVEEFGLMLRFPATRNIVSTPVLAKLLATRDPAKIDSMLLAFSSVADSDLGILTQLHDLKRLDLGGTLVTSNGIPSIVSASQLRELFMNDTLVNDEQLNLLVKMTSLRVLSLGGSKVTLPQALRLLGEMELESLFVHGLGGEGSVTLTSKSIVILDIAFSSLAEVTIGDLPKLETLVVSKSQLDDLSNLVNSAPNLKSIFVVDSPFEELDLSRFVGTSARIFGTNNREFRGPDLVFREINPELLYRKVGKTK